MDDLAPGDQVVMTFLPRCGECSMCATDGRLPCAAGSDANSAGELLNGGVRLRRDGSPVFHHLGVSAFATHAVVDRRSVVRVPRDVPGDVAALLGCAVLTGGGAVINAGRPVPGDVVIVVGLGGVGMAALMVAVALGHPVVGIDTVDDKLRRASDLGAAAALTPEQAIGEGVVAPVVIEAAGSVRAFETAFAVTAPGGATVTVGLPAPESKAAIAPAILTGEARRIVGSYLGSAVPERDIPFYVDLWRRGALPLERLVSRSYGLDGINEAMDRLASASELRQLIDLTAGATAPRFR